MITLLQLFVSPVGPALVLLLGAGVQVILGRWVRRPGMVTGLALAFVALATWLYLGLRTEAVAPTFSFPWRPPLQTGANLLWVGDGWNWYISGIILLLGGVGILLDLNRPRQTATETPRSSLAIHLAVLAAGLLFVGSGNILTAMLMWVVLDIFTLVRGAAQEEDVETAYGDAQDDAARTSSRLSRGQGRKNSDAPQLETRGLSLAGALLLLIGLLPAGLSGPGQPLQGGTLPQETIALMLVAGLIRAGIYPFHLWLLPTPGRALDVSQRLLDHMIPVLCGLWLLGWTVQLGAHYVLLQPDILFFMTLSLLGSALAGWTASRQADHTTFVLITSAGLAVLAGILAYEPGPSGLIWPTTAFALGGAIWLVGDQVWRGWGWQIPVSFGALVLAGVPFTPGFLTQPALARLLQLGPIFLVIFMTFALAQSLQIAAMLRSWSADAPGRGTSLRSGTTMRLLAAVLALGLPLAIIGFFPRATAEMAGIFQSIPPLLGNPPTVVAEWPVWVTLGLPLGTGIALVSLQPVLWRTAGPWPSRISRVTRLQWLFRLSWWGMGRVSEGWGSTLRTIEGAGYMGWVLVFGLTAFLLFR